MSGGGKLRMNLGGGGRSIDGAHEGRRAKQKIHGCPNARQRRKVVRRERHQQEHDNQPTQTETAKTIHQHERARKKCKMQGDSYKKNRCPKQWKE
jgi:hypothetical protein